MFRIREASSSDNEALLGLEAVSPQGTGITIIVDRDDYFYRSRIHDRTKVLLAEEKGKIVGVMACAIKNVLLNGEASRVAYFYDLRGEASYRRSMKRGLFRLWQAILAEIEAEKAAFIYGHVKADNHDSMNICTKMGARIAASFDILSLPSLPGTPKPLDPHLDRLDEEVQRIESAVGKRSLRPCQFRDPYVRGAELGFLKGIYRLEKGSSCAQVSVWDLSSIYRSRVLRMPVSLRLLGLALNPLSRFAPLPRVPQVGAQIAYLQLFDPICEGRGGARLLKELIQQLRKNSRAEGIDILTLFAYCDDPLVITPRFLPQKVLHYHTLVRPVETEGLPVSPLYLDIRDV